jgi:hypothetical protein
VLIQGFAGGGHRSISVETLLPVAADRGNSLRRRASASNAGVL